MRRPWSRPAGAGVASGELDAPATAGAPRGPAGTDAGTAAGADGAPGRVAVAAEADPPATLPASAPAGRRRDPTSIKRAMLGPAPSSGLVGVHALHAAGGVLVALSLADSLLFSVSFDAARPRIILYLVLTMAPLAVVAPAIGPVVDRLGGNHRLVLSATNIARALAAVLLAANLKSLLFYPVAFLILVLSRAYSVSKSALVPRLVDADRELVDVNARLARASTIAGLFAGATGAAVNSLGGAAWTVRGAAVTFLVAALVSFRLPRTPPRKEVVTPTAYAELHAPRLVLASTALSVQRAAVGFITFFLAFTFKRNGEPTWVFGAALAVSAVGAFGGTFIASRLRRTWTEELMLATSLVAPAVVALVAALQFTRPTTFVTAAALGAFANIGRVAFDSIVQRDAPDAEQGRAFARFETRFQLAWVVGGIAPVIARPSGQLGMAVLGAGLALGAGLYLAGARATRQLASGLHAALDAAVLGDTDPRSSGRSLPADLLRSAHRLADAGATRQAVVSASAAVEVARDRWATDPSAHRAALEALAAHGADLAELAGIRRDAIRPGPPLPAERAARAVELATTVIEALDHPGDDDPGDGIGRPDGAGSGRPDPGSGAAAGPGTHG